VNLPCAVGKINIMIKSKIRAFRVENGTKIYGSWSKIKRVKVK